MSESTVPDRPKSGPDPGGKEGPSASHAPGRLEPLLTRYVFIALTCIVATVLVGPPLRVAPPVYNEGDVAESAVKAGRDFLVVNGPATEAKRQEAAQAVPAVYDLTTDALGSALETLSETFALPPGEFSSPPSDPNAALPRLIKERLRARWAVNVNDELARTLAAEESRVALYRKTAALLEPVYARGVTGNLVLLKRDLTHGVILRDVAQGDERPLAGSGDMADFDEARRELAGRMASVVTNVDKLSRALAAALLTPNVAFNAEETAARRRAAAEAVGPVLDKVRRGEMLVREGDRVSADQARRLAAYEKEVGYGAERWNEYLSLFLILCSLVVVCHEFGRGNIKKVAMTGRDLLFMAGLFLFFLAMQRTGMALAERFEGDAAGAMRFGIPMAAAFVVARMALNSETVLVFALPFLAASAVGAQVGSGFFIPLAVGGLVGAHKARQLARRVDFIRLGLWVAAAQAMAAALVGLQQGTLFSSAGLWPVAGAFGGGLLCGFVALALVPIAESLFGYTTEMKLMELASLDHPLLRDLMIKAPGTYHHSVVVGTLVKSAAEAIGARAGLAMVAGYYHDVGKIPKPLYFIENLEGQKNPHDKLSPSMSTLLLTNHVKEGVDLAEKYRLGPDITDIIRQHHGTAIIRFFYEKALTGARPGVDEVEEHDFRYPGPKPQSREAGLVMLADAVEAAARTLPDPRPARIQGMVQNLINRIFADGQLDECALSLKDLHLIARSFTRILSGIHHQRVEYPLAAQKEKKEDGDLDSKRHANGRARRGEAQPESEENLKRLGM
jgi:putative nucleotidyltransferase with HDIG domain